MSAANGCSGTNNDFFEGTGARSTGGGALGGSGGTAGASVEPRGGTGAGAASSSSGESGAAAAARGGNAGANDSGNGGHAGDGDAGAPVHSSGGAHTSGQSGEGNGGDGNAGAAGDENAGGVNTNDAGQGGRAIGEGGEGGRAGSSGGEVATSGSGGEGGASLGGRDGTGGVPADGGVPGGAGVAGEDAGAGGRETGGEGGQSSACDDAERCDGVDNDCDTGVDEGGVCPESCHGFELEGRAYMFCTGAGGHFASAGICEDAAMGLVRIDSASENAGVLAAAQRLGANAAPGSIHIGATDYGPRNEGRFRWPDDTVFWIGTASGSAVDGAYTNWDQGEPNDYETNEDCVELLVAALAEKAGLWNDVKCSSTLSFVCEE